MNVNDLKEKWLAEEEIAHIKGWDFSHIEGKFHSEEDNMPWDYAQIIKKYLKPTDRILDMDTGGGEFLLSLGHPYALTSASEGYAPNVALCKETLTPLGIDLREMSDESSMPFDDNTFDIVLNRHGSYDPKEIYRVLKPGGKLIISTPNRPMSLTRNPWHVREYSPEEFYSLLSTAFGKVEAAGVFGNPKVMEYYELNKKSVNKILRFDVFDLQHRLPACVLQIPYDIANRLNRRKLLKGNKELTSSIKMDDYYIAPVGKECFDLFYTAEK